MCGLVAMFTTRKVGFFQADVSEFNQMMVLNSLRGSHSTGKAGINFRVQSPVPEVVKSIGSPYNLQNFNDTVEFDKRFLSSYTAVIGHGRYATTGDVNADNAHPFIERHITMAHNGVIRNFDLLKPDYPNTEVDSHVVCKMLADKPAKEVLESIVGAYVLIWFDSKEKTFNVARNSERPLFITKLKNSETLLFASEKETIIWNATRNKTPVEDIVEIKPLTIHTWKHDSLEATLTPFKEKVTSFTKFTSYGYGGYDYDDYAGYTSNLRLEQRITIEITNYHRNSHGYDIEGTSEAYPDILFKSWISSQNNEEDLINLGYMAGSVVSIYPSHMPTSNFKFVGRIGNCTIVAEPAKGVPIVFGDNLIGLSEYGGKVTRHFHKNRIKHLTGLGCIFCQATIDQEDVEANPDKYSYYEWENGSKHEVGLVCTCCNGDSCPV